MKIWCFLASLVSVLITGKLCAQSFVPLPKSFGASRLTSLSADGTWATGVSNGQLLRFNTHTHLVEQFELPTNAATADATGISTDGTVIVGGDVFSAFRFQSSLGFSTLPTTASSISVLQPTISDDSTTIGYAQVVLQPFATQAIVFADGVVRELDVPTNAVYSRASVLSADGSIAYGAVKLNDGQDMWLAKWTTGGIELLTQIPNTANDTEFLVTDATPGGETITGESFGPDGFGFRWAAGQGLFTYEAPVAQRLRPRGITDDGLSIVGTQRLGPGMFQAVIADELGFEPMLDALLRDYPSLQSDLAGWSLTEATGISGDGQIIIGFGVDPAGIERGWTMTVPAPMSMSVFLVGGFAVRRRRDTQSLFR